LGYIRRMRELIGNETLLTIGCGVIIEKDGQILLQHRTDEDNWCIPGGIMEIGETFIETAEREVLEETGLQVKELQFFGIYSGEECFATYPNGDRTYSVQVIFKAVDYTGLLKQSGTESREHRFFSKDSLPGNLNPRQKSFISDWVQGKEMPIIQ